MTRAGAVPPILDAAHRKRTSAKAVDAFEIDIEIVELEEETNEGGAR